MRIVHCLTRGDLGGGQVAVFQLIKCLRQRYPQWTFAVVLPPGIFAGRFRSLGTEVVELQLDRLSLFQRLDLGSFLRRFRPDIVHSHGKGAGLYVRFMPRTRLPAKRFHSHHGFHPSRILGSTWLYREMESILLTRTDRVIAVSPSEEKELRAAFPSAVNKIVSIPNVVDAAEVKMNATRPLSPEVDAFLHKNRGSFLTIMIARDDPVKNYDLALRSAGLVMEKKRETAFLFIGISGRESRLRILSDAFPDRVFAIAADENPSAILSRTHCLWLTSRKEGGLPLVIQEAFCLGKPVVATAVAGTTDIVHQGENGILCEETGQALSNALLKLSSDEGLYERISAGALKASHAFDQNDWAEQYHRVYERNDA